jgi:hypothetical protein
MQTREDRERLIQAYDYASASPQFLLGQCAIGLAAITGIAVAGTIGGHLSDQQLAERIEGGRLRPALLLNASEQHRRAVFVERQAGLARRAVMPVAYAPAAGSGAGAHPPSAVAH